MTFLNKLNSTRVKIFARGHLAIAITNSILYSFNVRRTFFIRPSLDRKKVINLTFACAILNSKSSLFCLSL